MKFRLHLFLFSVADTTRKKHWNIPLNLYVSLHYESRHKRIKRGLGLYMTNSNNTGIFSVIKNIFKPDDEHYEGVRRINIYLLRLVYALTFLFVGIDSWTAIINHTGSWDHVKAVAFCVWAAYSALSFLGLIHPLKMLPLVLFQIFYKVIWLIVVAYPLWRANQLTGSPAEEMAYTFLWVVLPVIAVPWKYVFENYILIRKKNK